MAEVLEIIVRDGGSNLSGPPRPPAGSAIPPVPTPPAAAPRPPATAPTVTPAPASQPPGGPVQPPGAFLPSAPTPPGRTLPQVPTPPTAAPAPTPPTALAAPQPPGGPVRPPTGQAGQPGFDPVAKAREAMQRERDTEAIDRARRRLDSEYDYRRRKDEERERLLDAALQRRERQQQAQAVARPIASTLQTAASLAGVNPGQGLGTAASLAGVIPVVGPAVSALITGFKAIGDAAGGLAERLSFGNPALASASAAADIRQLQGDLRRSAMLGEDLARFVESKSKAEQSIQDAMAQVAKVILPILEGIFDGIKVIADIIGKAFKFAGEVGDAIKATPLGKGLIEGSQGIARGLEVLARWAGLIEKNTRKDETDTDFADKLLRQVLDMRGPAGLPWQAEADSRLGFPMGGL